MGDKISKLTSFLKCFSFYIKLIFWVSIIILTGGVATWVLPENLKDEYKDDWELMAEWQEKQRIMHEGKK